ncbi:MAG: alpha-ketoglutarate-dependent dioxygenase AlkB [Alphaproteobacteria bacterium]|nr:alpha-ketoglutarate-dependent dioxygenase AlkB [Alphaproteobacteria bacterium]
MTLFDDPPDVLPEGVALFRQRLSPDAQRRALDTIAEVIAQAPLFRPQMPTGPYMINTLTNCGERGWVSDKRGYRYQETHPETLQPWPAIPPEVRECTCDAVREAGFGDFEPDACLVNVYAADGRLSLHRDYDEADFKWPIASLSFGNDADFVIGGLKRAGKTQTVRLRSGDVLVFGGPSRLRYHGVRKIVPGTSPLDHPILPPDGRINLTLRRAA